MTKKQDRPTKINLTSVIATQLIQKVGGDGMVVAAARVSVSGEEAVKWVLAPAEDNAGLINFLMKHRHGTPFEHSFLTFFVHAPIFVFREWHRHRIASYNETSARYKEMEPLFWIPKRERKMVPAPNSKSARPSFVEATDDQYEATTLCLHAAYQTAWDNYCMMLDCDIAKEVARACLPVGIYSSCWVSMNPRALMNFLSLRTHEPSAKYVSYPQAEIEEAARACEQVFAEGWPLTYASWQSNGRVAP